MPTYNIIHNTEQSRFETEVEGLLSVVDYKMKDGEMRVTHTGVPKELEGRGIAAALTKALIEYAKENDITVIPICPYTKAYMQKHNL